MRHRVAGRGLGRSSSHRKALIRNQITELLRHERIVTTEAKAKTVRPAAEKVITLGKQGSLHARRQAGAILTDKKVLKRLFDDIAPRFEQRRGGYTRIVKLGPRQGDGAHMALIELVDGPIVASQDSAAATATEEPEAVADTAADDTGADEAAAEAPSDEATSDEAEPEADGDVSTASTDDADNSEAEIDAEEETDDAAGESEAEPSADEVPGDDETDEAESGNKAEKEDD
jgi:large subunit ribosomal protein L17